MREISLAIIGGGAAGMAAAIEAKRNGINDLVIFEKEDYLGGILNQCIHDGFGLIEFKTELTGPEYLQRFVDQIIEFGIPYKLNTQVMDVTPDKILTYSNASEGVVKLQCKAIIFATGCYERGAGAILLAGDRPSGIITAGTAQNYLNIHGMMVGKKIVILGSGDIGLIMARRLTLEGAEVLCVAEIMAYANGLNRNIVQCLHDYDIPLMLSTTVSKVIGKKRLEKVVLSKVDKNLQIIPGTEQEIVCDTLILSVGLIPYTALLNKILVLPSSARWASVNQYMETDLPGIFICGNSLHVHDIVDFVSEEARIAGKSAALYIQDIIKRHDATINVNCGKGINYVLPQKLTTESVEDVIFKYRVKQPVNNQLLILKSGDVILYKQAKPILIPSEMGTIKIAKEKLQNITEEITLFLEDRQ
jgi:thioredoxin reductase